MPKCLLGSTPSKGDYKAFHMEEYFFQRTLEWKLRMIHCFSSPIFAKQATHFLMKKHAFFFFGGCAPKPPRARAANAGFPEHRLMENLTLLAFHFIAALHESKSDKMALASTLMCSHRTHVCCETDKLYPSSWSCKTGKRIGSSLCSYNQK